MLGEILSIGSLLAGMAASRAGAERNQRATYADYLDDLRVEGEQAHQRTAEATARNAVFNKYRDDNDAYRNRNDVYRDRNDQIAADNQTAVLGAVAPYTGGTQAARLDANEANRVNDVNSNVAAGSYAGPQLGVFDSPSVKKAYEDAINRRVNFAREGGEGAAKVSSYGDTWADNSRDAHMGAANISENKARAGVNNALVDRTNDLARQNQALMPDAQNLAGFQTEKIINRAPRADRSTGNMLQSVGGLMGTLAGSGVFNRTNSWFNSTPAAPVETGRSTSAWQGPR